jgi:hypothetical protein
MVRQVKVALLVTLVFANRCAGENSLVDTVIDGASSAGYGVGGVWVGAEIMKGVGAASRAAALVSANGRVASTAAQQILKNVPGGYGKTVLAKFGGVANAGLILPVGMLGVQFANDVKKFMVGEIDKTTLVENSVGNLAACLGGIGGGTAGALVGTEIGLLAGGPVGAPVGAILGGIVGSIGGTFAGDQGAKLAFNSFFGSNADTRALIRKSYRVLGLDQDASPQTIQERYRELCLKHHPDKGGSKDKFIEVHSAYEVIRVHLGSV